MYKKMKTQKSLLSLMAGFVLLMASFQLRAQTEVVEFIKGGIGDGERLIQAYLEPLGNGMGANLNGGWINTAKTHKKLGFDITLTVTAAFPPETAKTFDLAELGLTTLELRDPEQSSIAPTFAGSRDKGPFLMFRDPESDLVLVEFESVEGVNIPAFPLPMVKAGLGIAGGIELMGRFIPKYTYEDMQLYLWGAGIKYDVLQLIPVARKIPFFNASITGAYTKVLSAANINFQKSVYGQYADGHPIQGGRDFYDGQQLEINMAGFTGMALLSLDLPLITVYGGIGYSSSQTTVDLIGDYPLISADVTNGTTTVSIEDVSNPINLDFQNFSGLQYTGGLKLKIAVITIHADYTQANYSLLSVGVGLSFR
jgi:hypothetical protein